MIVDADQTVVLISGAAPAKAKITFQGGTAGGAYNGTMVVIQDGREITTLSPGDSIMVEGKTIAVRAQNATGVVKVESPPPSSDAAPPAVGTTAPAAPANPPPPAQSAGSISARITYPTASSIRTVGGVNVSIRALVTISSSSSLPGRASLTYTITDASGNEVDSDDNEATLDYPDTELELEAAGVHPRHTLSINLSATTADGLSGNDHKDVSTDGF